MGTYMSSPNTDKESGDNVAGGLSYGFSSMQGWRISQEDAHNCCPEFLAEKKAALFAVYDGHGGSEVAEYTANMFPEFLKKSTAFQEGRIEEALKEAFLAFDATLVEEDVVKKLKELAQIDSEDENEEEDELTNLQSEAAMPLKQLLEKITKVAEKENELNGKSEDNGSSDDKTLHMNGDSEEKSKAKGDADMKDDGSEESTIRTDVAGETKQKANSEDTNSCGNNAGGSSSIETAATALAGGDSTAKCIAASSSSSSGSGCTSASAPATVAEGSSSAVPVVGGSSAGGSSAGGSSAGGSSAGGSSAGGSSAGGSSVGGSSAGGSSAEGTDEAAAAPGSSTGRLRQKANKNPIPEDDEDEASMSNDSDDEDDSDEVDSDDSDMAEYKKSLEENGSEDEDDAEEEDELDDIAGGEEPGFDSGCTAVVALRYEDKLYVANAGDSRCVLSRHGKAVDMSEDHKPEDDEELQRIQKAGGWVTGDGRVKGGLNLSRSLGDHTYKQNKELPDREQMISALPDVKTVPLTEQDDFMVLACDGIWNVLSSQDVVTYVHDRLYGGYPVEKTSAICEELFNMCLAPDTTGDGTGCDNMTCIIVKFNEKSTADVSAASTTAAASTTTPDAANNGSGGKRAASEDKSEAAGEEQMDTAVTQDTKRARRDGEGEEEEEKR